MLTTTAKIASVALSWSIQNAGFVNQLSKNVSMILEIQKDKDVQTKHKLNAMYDVVQSLGNKLQSLKTRVQLKCHANINGFVYSFCV